jgi:hypothetical protein
MNYRRKKTKEKGEKKYKKSRKQGFLREILKIVAVGDRENGDFIGLMRFWAKNEGRNEHFFALFSVFFAKMNAF